MTPTDWRRPPGKRGSPRCGRRVVQADLRIGDPAAVVAYRLALPHIAEWFSGLDDARRQALIDQGVRAVRPLLEAWRPAVVLLSGRA